MGFKSVLLATSVLVLSTSVNAAIIIDVQEVAGNVVASYSGTLDLASVYKETDRIGNHNSFFAYANQAGSLQFYSAVGAVDDYNLLGFTSTPDTNVLTGAVSDGNIVGDMIMIDFSYAFGGQIWVNDGYQSGTAINGSNTFTGQDFTSLGLSSGSYTWAWENGSASDSLTVNVGAVPVPAAVWLFGSGLIGLIGVARRKKS